MKTKVFAVLSMSMLISLSAIAQNENSKFGIELNSGAAFPVKQLSNNSLNPGFGFEVLAHYSFMQHLGVFGGWGWNKLSADQSFAGNDVCFEETGYILGLQYMHPIGESSLSWYLRAAGLYNHIETEDASGNIVNDTGHGFGFRTGGGLLIPLGEKWELNPGVKLSILNQETDYENIIREMDYQYVAVMLGVIRKF